MSTIGWEPWNTLSLFHQVNFMDCCFGEDIQVANCDDFRDINLECTFYVFNGKIKYYQNAHGEQ